jgi:hypothetical protein
MVVLLVEGLDGPGPVAGQVHRERHQRTADALRVIEKQCVAEGYEQVHASLLAGRARR